MTPQQQLCLQTFQRQLPEGRVKTDALTLSVYARDASLYRIQPKAVIQVENEEEMQLVLRMTHEHQCPVGFRAAGTSLSGQALCEGFLIVQGQGWRGVSVEDHGKIIRLQPGVRGSEANLHLKAHRRKIGPDPASIDAAKIGGIAANNASGMCCGTRHNSYQTLHALKVIFADGSLLDTSDPKSVAQFRRCHPTLLDGIEHLRRLIWNSTTTLELIRHKYLIKNTTGYAMNAFIDHEDPIDIIAHLMIGSEGTLGFISEITYETVPDEPNKSNAMVYFDSLHRACEVVHLLTDLDISAIELMDTKALRSVSDKLSHLGEIHDGQTALLIDVQASSPEQLKEKQDLVNQHLHRMNVQADFTNDSKSYAAHWKIRKGMFPSVAAMRGQGETVIIEDVAFPLPSLAEATSAVQELFHEHGYHDAIIFGHAQAGNLHVVFNQAFGQDHERQKYQKLMDELTHLVVDRFGGSLKAEHGTGRNMAPFVKKEWGDEIYELMHRMKTLFDPHNTLNPGVLLSRDPEIHLKNFKPMPQVDPIIDACMECGFCEPVCPSRDHSLTPRARISAMREGQTGSWPLSSLDQTSSNEREAVLDTCAADGMCGQICPVAINTGHFVKSQRSQRTLTHDRTLARWTGHHLNKLEIMGRFGLSLAQGWQHFFGVSSLMNASAWAHRWSKGKLPQISGSLPPAANPQHFNAELQRNALTNNKETIVLFQSCINRVFGSNSNDETQKDISAAIVSLATKAGFKVLLASASGSCCGLPWASKGYTQTASDKCQASLARIDKLCEGHLWPILVDNSPCAQELKEHGGQRPIMDAVAWLAETALPRLEVQTSTSPLALHVVCSAKKMGIETAVRQLAHALSSNVQESSAVECCGFAGDKGFSHPELNRSALSRIQEGRTEMSQVGASSSTTCSLGLEWNEGIPYPHLAQHLDAQTKALGHLVLLQ